MFNSDKRLSITFLAKYLYVPFLMVLCHVVTAQKPVIVTTSSVFADMIENIAGGEIEVNHLVPIGIDPHHYKPTTEDLDLIKRADLILMNGLALEVGFNEWLETQQVTAPIILLSEGVDPILTLDYDQPVDPHAWLDPSWGLIYIDNIKEALSGLLPESKEIFQFNHGVYQQQIKDIDRSIQRQINQLSSAQKILITCHDAFRYYANKYGIKVETLVGTANETDNPTENIPRLSKIINQYKVPAIFKEMVCTTKGLDQLATDSGVALGEMLYVGSLGKENSSVTTYLDLLKHNTSAIVGALSANGEAEETTEPAAEDLGRNEGSLFSSVLVYVILSIAGLLLVYFTFVKKRNGKEQ